MRQMNRFAATTITSLVVAGPHVAAVAWLRHRRLYLPSAGQIQQWGLLHR